MAVHSQTSTQLELRNLSPLSPMQILKDERVLAYPLHTTMAARHNEFFLKINKTEVAAPLTQGSL